MEAAKEISWDERISQEKQTKRERLAALSSKMEKVADLLSHQDTHPVVVASGQAPRTWSWISGDSDWAANGKLQASDGAAIAVTLDGYRNAGRLQLSSIYPRGKKDAYAYGTRGVEITLAQTKDALQVVKELNRRFFPEYEKHFAHAIKVVRDQEDRQERVLVDYNRLAEILGQKQLTEEDYLRGVAGSGGSLRINLWEDRDKRDPAKAHPQEILVGYEGQVKVTLEMSVDVAAELLRSIEGRS